MIVNDVERKNMIFDDIYTSHSIIFWGWSAFARPWMKMDHTTCVTIIHLPLRIAQNIALPYIQDSV